MVEPTCNNEQLAAVVPSKDTLDELIMKGLDLIEEILDEQKKFELSLREGFMLMSKARYSMGTKSVGVLQLPTEEGRLIDALVRVDHADVKHAEVDCLNFFVVDRGEEDSKKTVGLGDGGDGLRKRTTEIKSMSLSSPVIGHNKAEVEASRASKKTDPLNWFGVLVPQALRSSQQIFQDNVHSVCRLASLRSHLESIRREYARVSKELRELNTIKSMADNMEIK